MGEQNEGNEGKEGSEGKEGIEGRKAITMVCGRQKATAFQAAWRAGKLKTSIDIGERKAQELR